MTSTNKLFEDQLNHQTNIRCWSQTHKTQLWQPIINNLVIKDASNTKITASMNIKIILTSKPHFASTITD